MSGTDWLAVLVLVGAVVLIICLDQIHDLDERRDRWLKEQASERRYRAERERLP